MSRTSTTKLAADAALRRLPVVRAVGGPAEVREAASVLERERLTTGTLGLIRSIARSVPSIAALLWRLATDPRVSLRHRVALFALATYLVVPIDPIPDFLPVIGALDDALLAAVVLRWVLRSIDRSLLEEHWRGSPPMLDVLCALSGRGDVRAS